jgi:exopolyphosphatase/guanosine-5'-triphosphate,3'-diphosphate pyrophosphatase
MTKRCATIDIGTNTVLLLVAEANSGGGFEPVVERAEITRLGRGVDRSRLLSAQGVKDTLQVLCDFAQEARRLGAVIAVSATSAVRDAGNGAEFLRAVRERIGLDVDVISGDREAQLTFNAVLRDFARSDEDPLVMIDIGGGSTELVYGDRRQATRIGFRRSFDVGSVRLTERCIRSDPVAESERIAVVNEVRNVLILPAPPASFRLVGVAGTVTTLYAVLHEIEPYDSSRVHGGKLQLAELRSLSARLCAMPLAERRRLPGLDPKRADVICAGALILEAAMELLSARECIVSDRGLRWGLLMERFGGK